MGTAKYNPSLGYLKGIAALFVVIGHSITYLHNYVDIIPLAGQVIGNVVSAVHVPMFILIAGYLCHEQNVKKYIEKKIRRLIIPFLFFSTLKLLYELMFERRLFTFDSILSSIYRFYLIGEAYWFVYCMFAIYLIAIFFWRENNRKYIFPIAVLLFCINSILGILNVQLFPEQVVIGRVVLDSPLFQIERIMQYLPYFLTGMWLQDVNILMRIDKHKVSISIISAIVVICCVFIIICGASNKNYLVKLIMAIHEMILLRFIVKTFNNNHKVLSNVGKYSFQIMLFDGFYRVLLFAIMSKFFSPTLLIALSIALIVVFLSVLSCSIAKKNRTSTLLIGI